MEEFIYPYEYMGGRSKTYCVDANCPQVQGMTNVSKYEKFVDLYDRKQNIFNMTNIIVCVLVLAFIYFIYSMQRK